MAQRPFPPLIEAFLVIEQPRQRLSHWISTLSSLDSKKAPPLAHVVTRWDPALDHAIVELRYDEMALGPKRLAFVSQLALLAEMPLIVPSELADGERRRLDERLARCTIEIGDQRTVVAAITELARGIREAKKVSPPPENPSRVMRPRTGSEENPVLLVHPKGTRDLDRRELVRPPLASSSGISPLPKPDDSAPRMPSPNVIPRQARAETVEVSQAELQDMLHAAMEQSTVSLLASEAPATMPRSTRTDQFAPTSATPAGIIYARYLRSGRWVPVRIGALSLKGAALLSGALPRLDDNVDVALSYGDHRALVRGPVNKVSSLQEAQLSGAATFNVTFELDDAARRQLTTLLTAARQAKVVIKPPPPRSNRRFPVEWPVCLGSNRGAMRANALDISRAGMFVRPQNPLALDQEMMFSAVLDDGSSPISGHAKTVRHISDSDAHACGLVAGWGLSIVEMSDEDRKRWNSFLERVEKRSEKRILIGAAPSRLAELQAGLAAAGYAVTGGTDAGALVQLASGEARPVDAAMIDGGWLTPGTPAQWVESLFSARNVPCVTVHGADGRRARTTVDKLLGVM